MILYRTGYFSEMPHVEKTDPSIKEYLHKLPKKNLENIIRYLQSGILVIMSPGNTDDVVNPQNGNAGVPSVYTDGKWAWPGDLIYYVKTYQVGLEQEFIYDTLLFSIAQLIESVIHFKKENLKNALEVNSKIQLIQCSDSEMLSMKSIIQNFNPNSKDKWLKISVIALNSLAFTVFLLGFVISIKFNSSINAAITIFSVAMLFLSMWVTECSIRRTEKWEEVMKIFYLNPQKKEPQDKTGISTENIDILPSQPQTHENSQIEPNKNR